MTHHSKNRPLFAGALAFTAATAMTSAAAIAACGGAPTLVALSGLVGPPSITATEASTDQALELIRKRREEATGICPAGFTRSGGNCVPTASAAPAATVAQAPAQPAPVTVTTTTTVGQASGQSAAPPAAAPAGPRPKQRVARVSRPPAGTQVAAAQPAPAPAYGYGGSIKDGGYAAPMPGTIRARGVWMEGYYDYERHKNLNPGSDLNTSRRMASGGAVAGVDVSEYSVGGITRGWQVGFFGGTNNTLAKFSDTLGNKFQNNGSLELTRTTDQRQEIDGGFGGIYGAMQHGNFSMDGAFKIDAFEMSQRLTETLVNCANVPVARFNDTSMTNYIVASNANYRFNLSPNHYIEPTVGLRYTHTDFGGNAPALGVRDGDAFRVQGGIRLGTRFVTRDGWIWNTALTGLLYSDVSLSGFVVPSATPLLPTTPLVDEGKLRVMGMLESRVDVGYGYTVYGGVDVRGGQDVIGFGSHVGLRYQW